MINFLRQKVKKSEQSELDAKLKEETAHIIELKIQKTELEIQKIESENKAFMARGVLYMSVLSLLSLFTFAGFNLYIGNNKEAKDLLNVAITGSTHLTTVVITSYFCKKSHK